MGQPKILLVKGSLILQYLPSTEWNFECCCVVCGVSEPGGWIMPDFCWLYIPFLSPQKNGQIMTTSLQVTRHMFLNCFTGEIIPKWHDSEYFRVVTYHNPDTQIAPSNIHQEKCPKKRPSDAEKYTRLGACWHVCWLVCGLSMFIHCHLLSCF